MINFKIKNYFKKHMVDKMSEKEKLMHAKWNGKTIAESDKTIVVEGNHYFPPESLNREFLKESSKTTVCPWKGTASYYDVVVEGSTNKDAAWYYPQPSEAAKQIKDYIAFWHGVEIAEG